MELFAFLSYGFINRALLTGSLIAVLCSTLGVFLVLRRLSLIGDGLAHVTFGSISIGLVLRFYPIYVAIPIVMLSSLGILKLIERARVYGDTAIGIVSSLGIAIGVLLASVAGGFNTDLFSYLFGNILSISEAEMIISIGLFVVSFLIIIFFYNDLLALTFDEETAAVSGINTGRIKTILFLLTALTVVLAMKMVGIMLISSLLILPAVSSMQVARGFKMTVVLSAVLGLFSVISGICISFLADIPTGAVIVIINFIFFVFLFIYKRLANRN